MTVRRVARAPSTLRQRDRPPFRDLLEAQANRALERDRTDALVLGVIGLGGNSRLQ